MVPRSIAAIVVLGVCSLAVACGGDETELYPWEPAEVEVGDRMVISRSASPGVGDAWQVRSPLDDDVIRLVDTSWEADRAGEAGGGGQDVFTFEAVAPGTVTVVLHNCFRCDDEGNSPAEYADLAVDVTYEITVR